MKEYFHLEEIDQVAEFVRSRVSVRPRVGLILGSGLGELAEAVIEPETLPFAEIPFWPVSTVQGHQGRIVAGDLEGTPVMILQGRVHYYEG